jgi:hypothetical protein
MMPPWGIVIVLLLCLALAILLAAGFFLKE